LRIIGGTARGMRLKLPPVRISRPTGDRVKEALFNIIHNEVPGGKFLDCFAGSGSIGIEALSRGAQEAHFIEKNGLAIRVLRENLEKSRLMDKAFIWRGDAGTILKTRLREFSFKVVFLDPPYAYPPGEILLTLEEENLVLPGGIVVLEASRRTEFFDLDFWKLREDRVYGDTRLFIWEKEWEK